MQPLCMPVPIKRGPAQGIDQIALCKQGLSLCTPFVLMHLKRFQLIFSWAEFNWALKMHVHAGKATGPLDAAAAYYFLT